MNREGEPVEFRAAAANEVRMRAPRHAAAPAPLRRKRAAYAAQMPRRRQCALVRAHGAAAGSHTRTRHSGTALAFARVSHGRRNERGKRNARCQSYGASSRQTIALR